MRSMRKPALAGLVVAAVFGVAQTAGAGGDPRDYVVVYEHGASTAEAREAIAAAGGRVVEENAEIGVATVRSSEAEFARDAAAQEALLGAAENRPIGHAPKQRRAKEDAVERGRPGVEGHPQPGRPDAPADEPLAAAQWDMDMIGANPEGSYRRQRGSHAVRVGIIDTGVDGSHPDLAPNFNRDLSRNFTTDKPDVDGPCEEEPDGSCEDPNDVDEYGHGTHVAGTVGAALNGFGIGGVAPGVELVNLRAAQDSGYFFIQETVNALTYAAHAGIDVVNMSFYIDPWLYNCPSNPADSPEDQAEQRAIIVATQRALRYARDRGVTLVGSAGNAATDLGRPEFDDSSPDYPPGTSYEREVDNSCLTLPAEGHGVIGVTALGPSKRKAYYSNYGVEQADLSAPGGDAFDPARPYPQNMVLSTYPTDLGSGSTSSSVMEHDGAYYAWFQGTSMASPHAAGVAALVVAEHGKRDERRGGLTLDPRRVEHELRRGATDIACPEPRTFDYGDLNGDGTEDNAYDATCEGSRKRNGFYGDGLVSAVDVLRGRH